MNTSGILDLALGMIFIFLVFSLIVSGINEAITQALALRARHLWRTLRKVLDGETPPLRKGQRPTANPSGQPDVEASLTDRLYDHSLIKSLEGRVSMFRLPWRPPRSRIDNLPTNDFSRALIDILVPAGPGETTVDKVKAEVAKLPDTSPLKKQLLVIASEAGGRLDQLREGIGEWFDARMEALSSAYKMHIKWVLIVLGLGVAISLNVDAVGAARHLYRDPALRTAIAQQATDLAKKCELAGATPSSQPQGGASGVQCPPTDPNVVGGSLRFPVGWPRTDSWGLTLVGWLVAAVALGQGAPFWFDALRKIAKLRG